MAIFHIGPLVCLTFRAGCKQATHPAYWRCWSQSELKAPLEAAEAAGTKTGSLSHKGKRLNIPIEIYMYKIIYIYIQLNLIYIYNIIYIYTFLCIYIYLPMETSSYIKPS